MKNYSIEGGNDWGGLGRVEGGNAAKGKSEKCADRLKGAGSGRQILDLGRSTGSSASWGPTRQNGDGNTSAKGEKVGSGKSERVLDLGRSKGQSDSLKSGIQVDGGNRGPSGNSGKGPREKSDSKKAERVTADRRW